MISPLQKISLSKLLQQPIMFDANIFMVGIEKRTSGFDCSFENMKQLYMMPLFDSFRQIMIHEMVYKELDGESRNFMDDSSHNKALKSIYKRYCEDVIRRHKLPATLKEYFLASTGYIN